VRPAAPRIASVVRMDWGHDGEKMGWQHDRWWSRAPNWVTRELRLYVEDGQGWWLD
jgi:hypothetical protein